MALLPKKREDGESPVLSLRDEVNRVFDDFFGRGWLTWPFEGAWSPALDVSETETAVQVRVEVPGISPEDIDISLSGDTLTVKGQKKEEEKKEGENYTRVERRYGSFQRIVTLPAPVDPAKVKATCKEGVLTIMLEKQEKAQPKGIEIKVE